MNWGGLFFPNKAVVTIPQDAFVKRKKAIRNIRGQAKKEAEYYWSNPLQRCQVCGRLFH